MSERTKSANFITLIGAITNILLSISKIIAGIIGHSQAIISDGIHSLSDLLSDVIVVFGTIISSKPTDSSHNYGHGKFETLSALIIGFILGTVGIGIGYKAIMSIVDVLSGGIIKQPGLLPFIVALISIASKEFLYRITLKKGKALQNAAVIANAHHHRSDAYSSIGTAIGIGGAIALGEKWVVLDPIAGLVVSLIIFKEAISIIKTNLEELLEISLPEEVNQKILSISRVIPGVYEPHKLRTRKVGFVYAVDLHIYVEPDLSITQGHQIAHDLESAICQAFENEIICNIHVEPFH